jgi:hypothetical protein
MISRMKSRPAAGATSTAVMPSISFRGAYLPNPGRLSLTSYVRHTLTDYDDLLVQGYEADSARFFVAEEMTEVLAAWGVRRKLNG